jgi:TonB family protein
MQIAEWFKETYVCGSKPGSRDTLFAISASLALHIGIFLLLTTATAMSTSLKLWEDPVLHVSLVSMPGVQESQRLLDTRKKEDTRHESRLSVMDPAAVVSLDKREQNKIQAERLTPAVVESRSVNFIAPATARMITSGLQETTTAALSDSGRQMHVASNASSSSPVSMAIPRYRDNDHPVYPWIARLRGYEGVVLLSAEIYADGYVGNLKLKKSSGFAVLDRSALDAVKTWKFEPGRRMGRPISMWVDVPVKFILRDNGPDDVARR